MYGEVLCEDEYQTAVDGTASGYHTVAQELFLLHAEVVATVLLKHVVLLEGSLVQQHLNALTGCVLALVVLLLYCFLTTTETGLFALLDELFDFL